MELGEFCVLLLLTAAINSTHPSPLQPISLTKPSTLNFFSSPPNFKTQHFNPKMKLPCFLMLLLSPLVSFAFTALSDSNNNPVSDGASPSPVLDADGGSLQAGASYFVLPVTHGSGRGLTSGAGGIIQEASEVQTGFPVAFSPVDSRTGWVPLSTDVNVKFFAPTVRTNETGWMIGKYDELLKQFFIVTGGEEGNPVPGTVANRFKIEKHGSDYKFVFCPSRVVCQNVGVFVGPAGDRFLALTDAPLVVTFKKTSFPPFIPTPFPPGPDVPAPLPLAPVVPTPFPPAPVVPAPPAPVVPAPPALVPPPPPAPDASSAISHAKWIFYNHVFLTFAVLCFF
ncbi:unnamed protein product [Cuscuta europaea]|uniref:Uncharacterized protein n=1 Tax=Cuscuta europaea TaxID=41803 RepID=A0A9P0Z656_CUSEU|nr:unnamed protein product [Cuscuta europaea]